MLNEWTYCNRLGVLMWVHDEFEHNRFTVDGVHQHRRADRPTVALPQPEDLDEHLPPRRSVWLSSDTEGLTAKMDVVELAGGELVPVDTKRGRPPDNEHRCWEPERVQLCAQALVLRDHRYRCERGYLYFAAARTRVEVPFTEALVARTRELREAFVAAAEAGALPPPLDRSPKCPRCSLVGICLPDETRLLAEPTRSASADTPRQLLAPRRPATPLFVTENSARIGVSKGRLRVKARDGELLAEVRLRDTSVVGIQGNAQMSTQALRAAMDADVPVCFFTYGGWFIGWATGHPSKNVVLRQAQYRTATDTETSLQLARTIIRSKIRNQRTLLRRNHPSLPRATLAELARLSELAGRAPDRDTLLGFEGAAARLYFQSFAGMLRTDHAFDFATRNRRPPRDPVNALLSYAYSLLVREVTVAALFTGFDPYLGVLHTPRYGRPALALDLMEELRPLVADSVVVSSLNNGELRPGHFYSRADGCKLTSPGRKAFIKAFYRRLSHELTHPIFRYKATWRRIIEIQSRLLGRHMLGELSYKPIETR